MSTGTPSTSGPEVLIETQQLRRIDERTGQDLLQPTDFKLYVGDHVAITGASGSGKSVFLRTIARLDAPSEGSILWRGRKVANAEVPRYRNCVCYLSQRPALVDGSVEDNLRFPYTLGIHRHSQFDRTTVTDMLAVTGKEADFLKKAVDDLSGGEAQITALIRALQLGPEVMLLDEPTAALDPASAQAVEGLVHAWCSKQVESSRAFVWVSHDHDQAVRMSNRMLEMRTGSLTEARVDELSKS